MIEGLQPADFRREWLFAIGKVSMLPNEHRYNSDGSYAFKIDSRNESESELASYVVCMLVDEIVLTLEKGETICTQDLNRWHLEYAKAGFRAANMAKIAYTLEQDPQAAADAIAEFLAMRSQSFLQQPGVARAH